MADPLHTAICERLGSQYPIVQTAMGWIATPDLVVASTKAGAFGFLAGAKETDVVLLVMNEGGENKLLESKFTIGGDASVAAGPVGRSSSAQTDAQLHAEILSWSRTQGVFAGISLEGSTLRPDVDDNAKLYGKRLDSRQIVTTTRAKMPTAAARFVAELDKDSDHEHMSAAGSEL